MKPDQIMGKNNYALAGHNQGGGELLFHPLHQAEKDMTIYTTDAENIYTYQITKIETVNPHRVDVITDSIPTWEDKDVLGYVTKGQVFPTVLEKVTVGRGQQYKVKHSKGKTFYITASPVYESVK